MSQFRRGGGYRGAALAYCVVAALLAGCGASSSVPESAVGVFVASATQWSPQHPGPTYVTVSLLASDTGRVRWQHREEWNPYHGSAGNPVVVDGVVYMVADTNTTSTDPAHPPSGVLLALRAEDGQQLWRTKVGALAARPVVDSDTVYVSAQRIAGKSDIKDVYALNRDDGSVRWKTEIADTRTISDTLVLSQGRLFLGASQLCFDTCDAAYLFALDTVSGHILWQQTFSGNFTMQPPVADEGVVYVEVPGYIVALSATDGHQLWQGSGGIYLVGGGVVYTSEVLSAPDPRRPNLSKYAIVAFDGETGERLWQTPIESAYPAVVVQAVDEGHVIVVSQVRNPQAAPTASPSTVSPYLDVVSAFDAGDGKQLWSAQQDASETHVTAAAGMVYLTLPPPQVNGQQYVAARNAPDGSVFYRQPVGPANSPLPTPFDFTVTTPNGYLFCVVAGGVLYGVRTTDGRTLWSANLSASGTLEGAAIVP